MILLKRFWEKYGVTPGRTAAALFIFVCLSVSLVSFYFSIGKIFTLDETDIAIRARMINVSGPRGPELYFGKNSGEAIPHPPLYDFTLAFLFRVFGETETAARGFGIFCFFASLLLTGLTLRHLLSKEGSGSPGPVMLLALGAFCLNPLLIQHSMLIDADGGFTFLFVSLFVYCFVRYEDTPRAVFLKSRLLLAGVFVLICLTKEGTPVLLSAGVTAYRLLGRQWKKGFVDLCLVFLLGAAVFTGLWLLFCRRTGIDPMIFLRQQQMWRFSRFNKLEFFLKVFRGLPQSCRWPLVWMTPLFFILLGMRFWDAAIDWFKNRKPMPSDICLLCAAMIWFPYLLIRPSADMMKYQHPVYPLFIVSIACGLARLFRDREPAGPAPARPAFFSLPALIFLAGLLCFYYYNVGDGLLFLFHRSRDPRLVRFVLWYGVPMLAAVSGAVLYAGFRGKKMRKSVALVCIFLMFPANIALNLRQTAPYTTAESWLNYGEEGLRETIDYLSKRITSGMPCMLRKDMVYYLQFRYGIDMSQNQDAIYLFRNKPLMRGITEFMSGPQPVYAVMDPVILACNPVLSVLGNRLFGRFVLEKKMGKFNILRFSQNPVTGPAVP